MATPSDGELDEWIMKELTREKAMGEDDMRRIGMTIETEPIIGWRVWRVHTRANQTYESQTMGSLATLIKLVIDNPLEEVLAKVASDVALESWGHLGGGSWPPYEPMHATHPGHHDGYDYEPDTPPVSQCGCGIWAFRDLAWLREQFEHFGSSAGYEYVCGTVALWGKVIVSTHGYRAEYAYPQELEYICREEPTDINRGVATAIGRRYGVPCVAMPPWLRTDPFRSRAIGHAATFAGSSSASIIATSSTASISPFVVPSYPVAVQNFLARQTAMQQQFRSIEVQKASFVSRLKRALPWNRKGEFLEDEDLEDDYEDECYEESDGEE